jgi:hypothetical protein
MSKSSTVFVGMDVHQDYRHPIAEREWKRCASQLAASHVQSETRGGHGTGYYRGNRLGKEGQTDARALRLTRRWQHDADQGMGTGRATFIRARAVSLANRPVIVTQSGLQHQQRCSSREVLIVVLSLHDVNRVTPDRHLTC